MLVVLIQPRTPSAALDFRYRGEHLGLSSLVAVLKRAGHRAIQLDDALDKRDLASTLLILEALRPDLVGVTVPAQTAAGTADMMSHTFENYFHSVYRGNPRGASPNADMHRGNLRHRCLRGVYAPLPFD